MSKVTTMLLLVFALTIVPAVLIGQQPEVKIDATATGQVNQHSAQAGIHLDNHVTIVARHHDGTEFARREVHNLVTNAGFDLISNVMGTTGTQGAACNYVAVTNTAITPAIGDTTLSGEIAANGLSRAIGTYAHTNGQLTYTVTKIFNASGTQASQATGLFNAASTGTMCYEATYSSVTVNNGDTLTVTWTVTLS